MRRIPALRLAVAAALGAVVVVGLAACGGGSPDPGAGDGKPVRGGTLTLLAASDADTLDPGRTYEALGYQVAYATQRPLYGYRPSDPSRLIPDLAAAAPRVSADGRVVTVRLRSGIRFSPPVSREVRSADVAYALERIFSANVANPYTSYFADLAGAPQAPGGALRPISGITTPDAHTIVFHLRHRTAGTFVAALGTPATAPVPREYARRFDAASPSTYGQHAVATGPYMVRNDAAGRLVGWQPGQRIELVRNPSWRRATDDRPAYLDRVDIVTDASDRVVAARQVLGGSHRVLTGDPPPSILQRVARSGGAQAVTLPGGSFRYMPLNTTIPPFDNVDVRRAVLAAFDRAGARQRRGGPMAGELATHFLPPGLPGYREAGGAAGPGFDFLDPRRAGGDLALAQKYLRRAGYPSGRYDGRKSFLMVAANTEPDRGVAELAKAQLERLGFKIRLRLLSFDAAIGQWCQVPARHVAICGGLVWARDVADPGAFLQPAFAGFAINHQSGNPNISQLADPRIDAAMRRAQTLQGEARLRAWAAIDRMITAQAPGILLQWDRITLLRSKDVAGVVNGFFDGWDLSYTGLR